MAKRLFSLIMSVMLCSLSILAGVIEGVVTDAFNGEPLIGASVMYAEGKGTSTNMEGQ